MQLNIRAWDGGFAFARIADLGLPEFQTFNHKQKIPRMRRREMPFALHSMRLSPGMSALDCTINPVGLQQRLAQLYTVEYKRRFRRDVSTSPNPRPKSFPTGSSASMPWSTSWKRSGKPWPVGRPPASSLEDGSS